MVKLSQRLKTICDFIPYGSKVIDVGTDHGLVPIYLTKYKNCHCVATDVSNKSIKKAKQNINKYNLKIKTKVTDGLNGIILTDQIIIISGIGTRNILKILNNTLTNDLIISTHTKVPELKKFLYKKGYKIYKETIVYEKNFYVITYYKFKIGQKSNIYISPYYSSEYLKYLLAKYKTIYKYNHKLKYKLIIKKIEKRLKSNIL